MFQGTDILSSFPLDHSHFQTPVGGYKCPTLHYFLAWIYPVNSNLKKSTIFLLYISYDINFSPNIPYPVNLYLHIPYPENSK